MTKPKTFDFFFGHTGLIDVFSESGQRWFSKVYQRLHKQGVRGVWGDLGEPEVHPEDMVHRLSEAANLVVTADEIHNVYGHQWAKLVNQSLAEVAANERPFLIMRSGFAGSQRYGMLPWTGDVSRSWGGLKSQVELSLQMGLFGLGYTHSDLGGFAGGESFDKEMYIRWLQFGAFQPIFRPHAQDNIAPEPIYHDAQTLNIIREYIKLRYRLTPYNYSMAYQNSVSGLPLMRPMLFEQDNSRDWLPIKDQFMWGESILIKPVTEPGLTSIPVHLPAGSWIDYWTDEVYEGGRTVQYPLTLERLPMLIKGGAVLPSVPSVNTLRDYSSQILQLDLYYDPNRTSSQLIIFEDDGVSADSVIKGQFELMTVNSTVTNGELRILLSRDKHSGEYAGMPAGRQIKLVVHNWPKKNSKLLLNGQLTDQTNYNEETRHLTTEFNWSGAKDVLTQISNP